MIKVAVMGYGTIGSGVVEVLEINKDRIKEKTGEEVVVKYILDLREFKGDPHEQQIVHDFSIIENDPEVTIVVEAMGGTNPAYPFAKACLLAGKHVVTSNKALVAAHGTELIKIAKEKDLSFLFEASVGGGIPLIRPLTQSLGTEQIEEISGILNGTTNYILSKMNDEGQTFEEALKQAQALGYAEANPEADVEGYDTCRKITILTALATGKELDYQEVYTEGITRITKQDFAYAAKLKKSIKLFGTSRMEDGKVSAFVCPMMIGKSHPLYAVSDVYNGVCVDGKTLGEVMFYGSGAGKLPTANAVVSDIVEIAVKKSNVPCGWTEERQAIASMKEQTFGYFLRVQGELEAMKDALLAAFGECQFVEGVEAGEFAVLTPVMTEEAYEKKAAAFDTICQKIRCDL